MPVEVEKNKKCGCCSGANSNRAQLHKDLNTLKALAKQAAHEEVEIEKSARESADDLLRDRIADEERFRAQKDQELEGAIATEQTARSNKDRELEGAIAEEARIRGGADDALRTSINNLLPMIERLVASITNNKAGQTLEIDGTTLTMSISGAAAIETYGDDPATAVDAADMTSKAIKINDTTIANDTSATYTIPTGDSAVKRYTAKFELSYNGVTKSASSYTDVNLRKFMGFCDSAPVDVSPNPQRPDTLRTEDFDVSQFANTVECTVTIPASGSGYKHIYFAVPNNMTITRIEQPDALNAPLDFELYEIVYRGIESDVYTYKLYRSTDMIACDDDKRITIK